MGDKVVHCLSHVSTGTGLRASTLERFVSLNKDPVRKGWVRRWSPGRDQRGAACKLGAHPGGRGGPCCELGVGTCSPKTLGGNSKPQTAETYGNMDRHANIAPRAKRKSRGVQAQCNVCKFIKPHRENTRVCKVTCQIL